MTTTTDIINTIKEHLFEASEAFETAANTAAQQHFDPDTEMKNWDLTDEQNVFWTYGFSCALFSVATALTFLAETGSLDTEYPFTPDSAHS